MSLFEDMGHAVHSAIEGAKRAGTAVVHTVEGAAGWVDDVWHGNVGTQAAPIPEVVKQVTGGGSSSWAENSNRAQLASNDHSQIAAQLTNMLVNLEPAWTGKAAEAARTRTQKFSQVIDSASTAFNVNGNNVADAANGFDDAKNSMEPMGDPPHKNFLDVATPWDTDTEAAINAYNATAQKNLGVYNTYAAHLDGQASGLRSDYGEIGPDTDSSSTSDDTGTTHTRNDTTGKTGRVTTPATVTPTVNPHISGPDASTPGSHDSSTSTGHTTGNDPSDRETTSSDGTTTAGFVPSDPRFGNGPTGGPGMLPWSASGSGSQTGSGPLSGVPGALSGGGFVPGPGVGSGSVPGSGGRGTAGEPGTPGGGRQTGARGLVEEPVRGSSVGRTAGGRLTGNNPSGMAPGAGRGKGEDDREHKRKFMLDEDTLFTDEDRKHLDPTTGLPPVPPTIGA
ncbi:WXG100 family type VII secretion target [Amycolatopsis sp. cmx-8-4]|uniref:WXG100 family type VII secretion target n=1 Tax=Amycolatopsis sp. cmx-8-4 TaxID=2790947 RepID=UPI00397D3FDF